MLSDEAGETATATTQAYVQGAGVVDGTLYVIGSQLRDTIVVTQSGNEVEVRTKLNRQRTSTSIVERSSLDAIMIETQSSSDTILVRHDGGITTEINAGSGNNTIRVPNGSADLNTLGGRDKIYLGDGDHVVDSGFGNDRIYTGNGDNHVTSLGGNNRIYLGIGDDTIVTGAGSDWIMT
ncbi:MAG: hypothetical protein Aurels2KO_54610 [Aureliella sp.]